MKWMGDLAVGLAALFTYVVGLALVGFGAAAVLGGLYRRRMERARRERLTSDFSRIKGRMSRLRRPTLLLIPAKEPGFSKLGGAPELPDGVAWPMGTRGPRTFVAQIDLGAFRQHSDFDWLPSEGRLYFFYDDERNGFADLVSVVYSTTTAGSAASPPHPKAAPFRERRVGFLVSTSIPSLDWLGVDVREIDVEDDELDQLAEAPDEPFGDEIQHRIGGYPAEIQDEQLQVSCEYLSRGEEQDWESPTSPEVLKASKQWRMLLQVDSDPALKMNWHDGGRLYVFVREKDAKAGDFSKTATILQSH